MANRRAASPLKCFRGGLWATSAGCWLDEAKRALDAGEKAAAKGVKELLVSAARDAKRASAALPKMRKEASFIAKTSLEWSAKVGETGRIPKAVRNGLSGALTEMVRRLRPMVFGGLKACGSPDTSEFDMRSLYGGSR